MGSATAWQLSQADKNVLLLEQQGEEYTFGSSYGEARICRSLGPKNDIWSYLHQRALEETKQLIEFLNTEDDIHHKMADIYTDAPVTYVLHTKKVEAVQRMLRQQDDDYKCATSPTEALDKFGVKIPTGRIVIQEYKKYTGTMNPKALIQKLHKGILLKGNEINYKQQIKRVRRKDKGYQIEVLDLVSGTINRVSSKKIAVAAGPYSGPLSKEIAPVFDKLITPKRVFLAFLKIDPKRFESYNSEDKQKVFSFYPLIDLGPDHVFSMIEKKDEHGHPLLKVGGHYLREEITDLDETWSKGLSGQEIAWSKMRTLDYFKFLNVPLKKDDLSYQSGYSCVYSLTDSEVPIVSNLPNKDNSFDPNGVILGGMSGVGAKGSLTYGLLATHLLLNKDESGFMYQKVKNALNYN